MTSGQHFWWIKANVTIKSDVLFLILRLGVSIILKPLFLRRETETFEIPRVRTRNITTCFADVFPERVPIIMMVPVNNMLNPLVNSPFLNVATCLWIMEASESQVLSDSFIYVPLMTWVTSSYIPRAPHPWVTINKEVRMKLSTKNMQSDVLLKTSSLSTFSHWHVKFILSNESLNTEEINAPRLMSLRWWGRHSLSQKVYYDIKEWFCSRLTDILGSIRRSINQNVLLEM